MALEQVALTRGGSLSATGNAIAPPAGSPVRPFPIPDTVDCVESFQPSSREARTGGGCRWWIVLIVLKVFGRLPMQAMTEAKGGGINERGVLQREELVLIVLNVSGRLQRNGGNWMIEPRPRQLPSPGGTKTVSRGQWRPCRPRQSPSPGGTKAFSPPF